MDGEGFHLFSKEGILDLLSQLIVWQRKTRNHILIFRVFLKSYTVNAISNNQTSLPTCR